MEKIIVYIDDADYAHAHLAPLLAASPQALWLLVACAPRMTRRISKWVNQSTREKWRDKWADKLFTQLLPPLHASGARTLALLADGPLTTYTEDLMRAHATQQVVDLRRPKFETSQGDESAPLRASSPSGWAGAVAP